MRHRHIPFLLIFAIVYLFANLTGTLVQGEPVYPMLTWTNFLSYAFIIIMFFANLGVFHGMVFLSKC